MQIAPLPNTEVICFYVTCRPSLLEVSPLTKVQRSEALNTVEGLPNHLFDGEGPLWRPQSLPPSARAIGLRSEGCRDAVQSNAQGLGLTSCHRFSLPSSHSAFTRVSSFDPSNNSEIFEGYLKKRGLVTFKSCRIKASLGADLLTPNPEFFYEAFV